MRVAVLVLAVAATLAAAGSVPRAESAVSSAFVRVNQVGYPASGAEARLPDVAGDRGRRDRSLSAARAARRVTGTVGPSLGAWSNTYGFVYPLDFDGTTAPGTYTIAASGPVRRPLRRSRSTPARTSTRSALANALSFYQAERDGPNYIPSALRSAPAHLNDRNAMTYVTPNANSRRRLLRRPQALGVRIDASGGWWDAGDYLEVRRDHRLHDGVAAARRPRLPGRRWAPGGSDFTHEAKFGADWLLRMWDDPTRTLYYQVGIGWGTRRPSGDHDIWRLPQARRRVRRHRSALPLHPATGRSSAPAPPGSVVSPNLAGRDAAAFALVLPDLHDERPGVREPVPARRVHIFDLANTNPGQLTTAIPFSFYPETEWRDDLELGAAELYLAIAAGGAPAGLPHPDPVLPRAGGALGERVHDRRRTMRPTR